MLFNSLPFLFFFLPVTYLVFWRLTSKSQRYIWLTITGYVFYSFWNYKFCALMAFSTLVSYGAGLGLLRWDDPLKRRLCLVLPITVDLVILGFFKYVNFLFDSGNQLMASIGLPTHFPALAIVLPIGISFYTFHTISYIVDSYRGVVRPTRNFFEFSCYVSLFSQLVAGPIVRFRQVEADLENIDHAERGGAVNIGWSFFTIGLVKKVLIADSIAAIINPELASYGRMSTPSAWLCMIGYSYQLYFDFSGYSDMAVGLGYLFGIRLPQNFNSPYKAVDIADFWRRWHISLSTCLRDYVYIPLGGNRGGDRMIARNLLLTMLIGGLWHGASWTFVIWGAYHGLLLVAYRFYGTAWDRLPVLFRQAGTFCLVVVGWVFFRCEDFSAARRMLLSMFTWTPGTLLNCAQGLVGLILLAGAVAHGMPNTFELGHNWGIPATIGLSLLLVACMFVIMGGRPSPFLYFQF